MGSVISTRKLILLGILGATVEDGLLCPCKAAGGPFLKGISLSGVPSRQQ